MCSPRLGVLALWWAETFSMIPPPSTQVRLESSPTSNDYERSSQNQLNWFTPLPIYNGTQNHYVNSTVSKMKTMQRRSNLCYPELAHRPKPLTEPPPSGTRCLETRHAVCQHFVLAARGTNKYTITLLSLSNCNVKIWGSQLVNIRHFILRASSKKYTKHNYEILPSFGVVFIVVFTRKLIHTYKSLMKSTSQ